MERINAVMEDDVKFQNIKNSPKRSHFYSVHRQLSWQCQRDVEKFEKDAKIVTVELSRNQNIYRERLSQLHATKRQLVQQQFKHFNPGVDFPTFRRRSCPVFNTDDFAAIAASMGNKFTDTDEENLAPNLRREQTVDVGSLAPFKTSENTRGKGMPISRSNTIDESVELQRRFALEAAVRRFTMPHVRFPPETLPPETDNNENTPNSPTDNE